MELLNKIPNPIKWGVGVGLVLLLGFGIWYRGSQVWNGIGNKIFEWKIGKKQEQVNKELADAAEQKKVLEQTLLEYGQANRSHLLR